MRKMLLFSWAIVLIGLCLTIGAGSCSGDGSLDDAYAFNEGNVIEQEGAAFSSDYGGRFTTFTFALWAPDLQNGIPQYVYIRDLYDIRISIAPLSAGHNPGDGSFSIDFRTDPEGVVPVNFVESRINNCHYQPDAVMPQSCSNAMADILFTEEHYPGMALDDWLIENSVVAIQLKPKSYITDMQYKPRLIVSMLPLSQLVEPSGPYSNMCINVYYDCNSFKYYNAMEFEPHNPPILVLNPNGYGTVRFKDGTERSLYEHKSEPLPKYDGEKYFLDEQVTYYNGLSDTIDCPYKTYYKVPTLVPMSY